MNIRNRISIDWETVPALTLLPGKIPPEVELKAAVLTNQGRPSLLGPGKVETVTLESFRTSRRLQELVFDLTRGLARTYLAQSGAEIPAHVLFPQLLEIVNRYLAEKVVVHRPANLKDVFLAPYYGWLVEILFAAIRPDASQGEVPEIPRYEANRKPGSTAEVDFWTKREVREVLKSQVNFVVADTDKWEQSATYYIDTHPAVGAFVKNAGLGFAIPYLHNGQMHDYLPDFIIRLKAEFPFHFILETKGYDPLEEIKHAAAVRWINAVNADGKYGRWHYAIVRRPNEINSSIDLAISCLVATP
ncbi:MAG: hypothetical protein JST84_06640 [Acidobacteria bacterium]|nr:hypothetical protein [Acidobacteriota bacterium]